ncbi:hypothetical protein NIE88_12670 [Sporolactobacillus shoreicorticis]|uniref:Uncharacterized protein n=1 Tax=Sporolactobacillus shoreicorticis TaxID=1923877 RepID=A0ABW5S6G9_9BACL|nr:hypothetical protein [Sporolactobacillus shoreicorticis]MCO7126618.1 hypothetical protein [Sporolactobacillus shoreicorticis]
MEEKNQIKTINNSSRNYQAPTVHQQWVGLKLKYLDSLVAIDAERDDVNASNEIKKLIEILNDELIVAGGERK